MNEQQSNYNPLEIKEGYIPRFFSWCKTYIKRFKKQVLTLGVLGVVLTGIQTYMVCFSPDVASEINEVITSSLKDYQALTKIDIPESLLGNEEVKMLKRFQDEFEIYKLHLMTLDYSEVRVENKDKRLIYSNRVYANKVYSDVCIKQTSLAQSILDYEANTLHDTTFGATLDANILYEMLKYQKIITEQRKKVLVYMSDVDFSKLSKKAKRIYCRNLEKSYASKDNLKCIRLEREFYKSFYLATSIKLKRIIMDNHNKVNP